MTGRRSLAALIGQHCAPFRRSQRTTLTAQVFGLLMGRRRGLASIARRMAGPVSMRHKIKRVGRFADSAGMSVSRATVCLVECVLSLCCRRPVVALDWTALAHAPVMLVAAADLVPPAVPLAGAHAC